MTVRKPNRNFADLFSPTGIDKLFIVNKKRKNEMQNIKRQFLKKITILEIVSETVSRFNMFRRNKLPMDFKKVV